jgi:hypothetical protein
MNEPTYQGPIKFRDALDQEGTPQVCWGDVRTHNGRVYVAFIAPDKGVEQYLEFDITLPNDVVEKRPDGKFELVRNGHRPQ